jgi:hypothetical protein
MNSANLYCNFNRRSEENRIENFLFVFFSLHVKPNSKSLWILKISCSMNSANLYCNFNRRGAENRIENFLFVFFSLHVKPNSKSLRLCGSYKYYVPLIQLTVYLFYHRSAENRIETSQD